MSFLNIIRQDTKYQLKTESAQSRSQTSTTSNKKKHRDKHKTRNVKKRIN